LERGMIFDELAQREEIEINDGDLEAEFNQTMMNLASQGYNFNNVKGGARAQKAIANNVAQQSATQLMTRLTLDRMKDIATGDFAKAEKEAAKAAKASEAAKEAEKEKATQKAEKEKATEEKKAEEATGVEEKKAAEAPEEKSEEASE